MDEIALFDDFGATAPGRFELARDAGVAVHLWAVPLDGDPEPFLAPLSASERERAGRFHFADHRRRYEITHGALRHVLAGYVGKEPADLEFRLGPKGKPYLEGDGAPFFSLSHSGKLTLIGVAATELGVDCEKLRRIESYREIAQRHFSAAEFAGLEELDDQARLLAFYRCWTRKEAYIKALGEGLTMGLDTFDVSIDEEPKLCACREGDEQPDAWRMLDVSPGPDFVGALAMRCVGGSEKLAVRRFRLRLA